MAVSIQAAARLVRSGVRTRQVKVFAGLASRDGLQPRGIHRGRHASPERCDGGEFPGRMDIVDVVGKNLAEGYTRLDQDSRRVWIVSLQRDDPTVSLQAERRRRR